MKGFPSVLKPMYSHVNDSINMITASFTLPKLQVLSLWNLVLNSMPCVLVLFPAYPRPPYISWEEYHFLRLEKGSTEMMLLWKLLAKHFLGSTWRGRLSHPPPATRHCHFTQCTFHPKSRALIYKEEREKQAVYRVLILLHGIKQHVTVAFDLQGLD